MSPGFVSTLLTSDSFKCNDSRSCVSRKQVCDGRSHCFDGSDEVGCPTVAAPVTMAPADRLKCRRGLWPCKDGTECIVHIHVCDREVDCKDGSDEEDCGRLLQPLSPVKHVVPCCL